MGLPYHININFPLGLPLSFREIVTQLITYEGQYTEADLYAIIQDLLDQLGIWSEVLLNQEIVVPWISILNIPLYFVYQEYADFDSLTINST